ncbi:MAG: acyl-CoA dehydrogenase family protein [Janthinobacterium lividum]
MDFAFTPRQQSIYDRIGELGRTRFAARAADYDRRAVTPVENLRDLFEAGVTGAAISEEFGGLGSGPLGADPLLAQLVVEQTARYCLSTAHSIHIHYVNVHRLEAVATPEQRARILPGVSARGDLINGTASEPGRTARGLYNLQTTAEKVSGGWILNGYKNYSTLADVAKFNIIAAVAKGKSLPEGHMTFLVPQDAEGFSIVPDTWDTLGMRAAYSPDLKLTNCFVADENVLGAPGETPANRWQAKSHASFAAQYVGASEGIFDFLVDYLPQRGTAGDAYAQLRLGEIRVAIDAARWLSYRAAWLWQTKSYAEAELFAMNAKHQALDSAITVMDRAAQIAGSSALSNSSALPRLIRDLRYQTLHENFDKTAATLGKFHLGQTYDVTARL